VKWVLGWISAQTQAPGLGKQFAHAQAIEGQSQQLQGQARLALTDQSGKQGTESALVEEASQGEKLPKQAMQPGELDDEAHPPGGVLTEKDQAHASPLALNPNQIRDLIQAKSRMPVVANGLRAADQLHALKAQTFAKFKVFPTVETKSWVKKTRILE
jgi:hypothetical protein